MSEKPVQFDPANIKEPPACQCDECKSYCKRPGWYTPDEARAAIEAGLAQRMMCDWWEDSEGNIDILGPAIQGYEGRAAPWWPSGWCTFYHDGQCDVHGTHKPLECRVAHHAYPPNGVHGGIAKMWDTSEGRKVVALWEKETDGV